MPRSTIQVTVDKSHIITIGEKLYAQSVELVRELVNNAYDADASEVHITLDKDEIRIEDNGSGMDENGILQYFNIGSEEKKQNPYSPKYHRRRIGEFGIGKFASLSACDQFILITTKRKVTRQVVFDKKEWNRQASWDLPIKRISQPLSSGHGTSVTLRHLNKKFDLAEIEHRIREQVPIQMKNFTVFLNGKRIVARYIPGKKFSILHHTLYGDIYGDIILASNPRLLKDKGIACKVRGYTIKRELFDLDPRHLIAVSRLTGEIHADFLPVTSDRSNFIVDSTEYKLFKALLVAEIMKIVKDYRHFADEKENKKIQAALREAMSHIRTALKDFPDLQPPKGLASRSKNGSSQQLRTRSLNSSQSTKKDKPDPGQNLDFKPEDKQPTEPKAPRVVKKFRLGGVGLTCSIEHLGSDSPESYTEGNVIYINCDHPLYRKFTKNKDTRVSNLVRLISRELAMIKSPPATRKSFDRQSELMAKALTSK
ncbi:MAG TPA: hypothetical protein ENN77_00920 [Candidatus Wirthbacteria bacterium]|nr:hypothetical protein [Candidatus Wirthbacteria bacterium]